VWEAIGSEDASAVLAAIKCWTSARPKPQGLVIDKASGLMVYKLTQKSNPEDVYGTSATFIAFGYERPTKSVFDMYLNPDALRRPRVAVSGKRVSTSGRRRRGRPLADGLRAAAR